MNKHLRGGLLITLSMFLFSWIGPFVRYIDLPPMVIIFHTSLFTALIIFLYYAWTGKLKALLVKKYLLWLILSALFVFANVYMYYKAYQATTMANAVLTHYTAPIFAALLAPLILKEKLERVTIVSLVISMSGLFLIASTKGIAIGSQHLAGIIYGCLSGLFYGLSILVSKKLVQHYQPFVILFFQCVLTAIIAAPFLKGFAFTMNLESLMLLTGYTFVVCLIGVYLYLRGLVTVEAQHAGILAYSEPVVVVMLGFLFYNEIPTVKTIVGGLLIVLSGCLILRAEAQRE